MTTRILYGLTWTIYSPSKYQLTNSPYFLEFDGLQWRFYHVRQPNRAEKAAYRDTLLKRAYSFFSHLSNQGA